MNIVYLGMVSEEADGDYEYSTMEIEDVKVKLVPGHLLHQNAVQLIITLAPGELLARDLLYETDSDDDDD